MSKVPANLTIGLFGKKLRNPLILASGFLGVTKSSLKNVAQNGAGAVTIKSISREPRQGHKPPVVLTNGDVMINAVGYSNPGIEEAKREFSGLGDVGVPVIASIIGEDARELGYMAKNFLSREFAAVEVPLSCPHTPGYGLLAGQGTPEATLEITKAVKGSTSLPVIIKISANVQSIGEVAKAAVKGGADAINVTNTIGPGMFIDVQARKPVLGFGVGGLSGPAIKPIAVRCVFDVYEAVRGSGIPIIGTGGVTTGQDAVELIMAGASAVGIGSAIHFRGIEVFRQVCGEMAGFMESEGFSGIKEMVGIAHD
ncbi:MAG: dihydroorotate dehydrogenase [Candidatus Aenigmarchaeota archaeon]|nr:dihydroorotate dehydrogenase [Candidatus Aenigmarchaeota archaeon]